MPEEPTPQSAPTEPPPEARLIEHKREDIRPKMSVRAAAAKAGISEGRWRQIAKGYNQATRDVAVPVVAPAETLARMANAVGATASELAEVGRRDAANELAKMQSSKRHVQREFLDSEGALLMRYEAIEGSDSALTDALSLGALLREARSIAVDLAMRYTDDSDMAHLADVLSEAQPIGVRVVARQVDEEIEERGSLEFAQALIESASAQAAGPIPDDESGQRARRSPRGLAAGAQPPNAPDE